MSQHEALLDRSFGQIVKESIPRKEIEPELRTLSATDEDVRLFRRIRLQQKRTQLDHWLVHGQGTRLRKTLARTNRALGNPGRIMRAVQAAVLGTHRSGTAVAARHKIGIATQFLQVFAEVTRSGIWFEEYYLYQLYMPERWRTRTRQFQYSQTLPALRSLNEHSRSPDFQVLDQKHLFAAHCEEAGLPSVRLLAQFIDGHPDGKIEGLPETDLFSKPANQYGGIGAEAWRYDRSQDCFFNAATDQRFSSDALFDHLCDLSRSGRVILQNRLRNHAALSPLTNGALSTLRLVTCRAPSGSIDLMPPVIRMPTGRLVVDNSALAAPIDFATGTICGPALQKDNCFGVTSTDRHPDSGQKFKGFPIPMWSEAVDLARRAHETFPSMYFIAWDTAILQDGPVLVEGNAAFDTDVTVLPHGLTLSDTQFIPYYNYHWANSLLANAAATV
jgi:Sugar-transfer associated ATP-grasp